MKKYLALAALAFIFLLSSAQNVFATGSVVVGSMQKDDTGRKIGTLNIMCQFCTDGDFGSTPGTVTVGGFNATLLSDWGTQGINARVPAEAQGLVEVIVTTADSRILNAGSVVVNPKINNYTQEVLLGGQLNISGEGFGSSGKIINKNNGTELSTSNWTNSNITVNLLANGTINVGSNQLFVRSSDGLDSSVFSTTVAQGKCSTSDYSCTGWSVCSSEGLQTRSCTKNSQCDDVGTQPPSLSQSCIPPIKPKIVPSIKSIEDAYQKNIIYPGDYISVKGENFGTLEQAIIYSFSNSKVFINNKEVANIPSYNWMSGGGTDIVQFYIPTDAVSGFIQIKNPAGQISEKFNITITPPCNEDTWSCTNWASCSVYGTQNRTCTKTFDCSSTYTPSPATSQSCTPPCNSDTWSCGNWTSCSSDGSQTRICNKTNDCATADTLSPSTVQNCTPPQPTCTADTWTCETWGTCSLSGIQSRNCSKTFDCPSVQTAPPIADQFCETPNRPQQAAPSESEEITNQDTIIKATVKLLCPVDERQASQGSGTVIDSAGTILTNKHVIAGTLGCLVGFIDNFSDEPYFGDRQIADIVKISSNQDIAVLKIRNPKNKALTYVNTTNGNVNFALGTKITTYGYPAKFGTKVTYTSGDFSGIEGSYLKTTAILTYGNSGGGAYLKNGTYIGIPSAVRRDDLNAMGYILSINTIRAWLNNSTVASGNTNNNYSRVSVLEDIDLKKLGSLKLFIPNVDKNSNLVAQPTNQNTQKTTDQSQVAPQQESVVIESNNLNKDSTSSVQNASTTPEQPQKISLIKRFFLWLSNLFNRLAKP